MDADTHAILVLRSAGVDTHPMAELFRAFDKESEGAEKDWVWLSSHPVSSSRADRFDRK